MGLSRVTLTYDRRDDTLLLDFHDQGSQGGHWRSARNQVYYCDDETGQVMAITFLHAKSMRIVDLTDSGLPSQQEEITASVLTLAGLTVMRDLDLDPF